MNQNRKLTVQPPPDGIVWIEDYQAPDGSVVPGIASRLGISPSTYRKWRMRGEGPLAFVIGKKVAARIESIEAYLAGLEEAAVEAAQAAASAAEYDMRPAEPRQFRTQRKHPAPEPAAAA
ncbi:hypothetical protein PXH67_06520 [Streptomyces sp. P8-A8]|uniref:helix-turn-helix transcriptional regulator n=1 Tax=unclassified Streptomyces TaxID=2593676 RepID=UPI0033EB3D3F